MHLFYLKKKQIKNVLVKSGLLCLLLSLSSCFDFIEELNLNDDGSGSMTLTINLSKSKTKVASLMLLDSVNGHKIPSKEDIETALDEAVSYLEKETGISKVIKKADYDNYIFSISYHFTSVNSVNDIVTELLDKQKIKPFTSSYNYDKNNNTFSLNYRYNDESKLQFNKLKTDDKKVFNDAFYTSIYRFDKEIEAHTNTVAKLSKSKKAVMLKTAAIDLIHGKTDLTNKIQLNR